MLNLARFKSPLRGLFYGWWMLVVGCIIRMLGGGFHLYGFTIFFLPITNELGLSRAATSLVFSLARAEGAIEGPLAGYLIDRFGPRPMMIAGIVSSGVGYMILAGVNSYYQLLAVYLGLISLSFSAGFMHSPMALANSWFIRRRAFAMTLISSSVSIGGSVITPLLAFTVQTWGWRHGALLSGIGMIVLGLPVALLAKRSPEEIGLLPDGAERRPPPAKDDTRAAPKEDGDFSLREAIRTRAFWMIVLATTARVAVYNSISVHFIPIMVWKGVSESRAAAMLAVMALMSLPALLFIGWVADFVRKPLVMGACMLAGTAATVLLAAAEAEWQLWCFTLLFTLMEAIFPVGWATVGDYFGRKSFATIRGTMSFFYLWGPALGPVVTGAVYDRYESYAPMMSVYIALSLVASCLYTLLKEPVHERPR